MITITADGVDLSHVLDFEHVPQMLYEFAPDAFKKIQGSTRGFLMQALLKSMVRQLYLKRSKKE